MLEKMKNIIAKQGIKGALSAIKTGAVIMNDNWNLLLLFLLISFIYGVYLLFAYNVPIDAEDKGMESEEASYNRKQQKKGYLILLGCCLILAIITNIVLV